MTFSGICLITNDVCRLSEFYQTVLQTPIAMTIYIKKFTLWVHRWLY